MKDSGSLRAKERAVLGCACWAVGHVKVVLQVLRPKTLILQVTSVIRHSGLELVADLEQLLYYGLVRLKE